MEGRPCWCAQWILWDLNSILMLTFSFVLVEKMLTWPHWSRVWRHSISSKLVLPGLHSGWLSCPCQVCTFNLWIGKFTFESSYVGSFYMVSDQQYCGLRKRHWRRGRDRETRKINREHNKNVKSVQLFSILILQLNAEMSYVSTQHLTSVVSFSFFPRISLHFNAFSRLVIVSYQHVLCK